MHAGFRLQVSVCEVSLELYGAGLDSGLVAFHKFRGGHLVIVALAPADVHTHQHCAPVVGLGAAGAGVDGEHRPKAVAFGPEHILELQVFHLRLGNQELLVNVLPFRVQFRKHLKVFNRAFGGVEGVDPQLERTYLLEDAFRGLGIVPEISGLGALFQRRRLRFLVSYPKAAEKGVQAGPQIFDLLQNYHIHTNIRKIGQVFVSLLLYGHNRYL